MTYISHTAYIICTTYINFISYIISMVLIMFYITYR